MDYKKLDETDIPSEAPPPYSPPLGGAQNLGFQPPPPGFSGSVEAPGQYGQSVACECCGFSISLIGLEPTARLVQCTHCNQHTPIKPPPGGKKYARCACKKLLHCSVTASKVRCPGCKTVLSVGAVAGSLGGAVAVPNTTTTVALAPGATCRIICAYCNDVMLFASRGIARCPHCRRVSSVGRDSARIRAIIYFILAFIFLGGGIGVTVGTYAAASVHGGYYYVWTGSYISGFIWLLLGIRYAVIRVSYPENCIPA